MAAVAIARSTVLVPVVERVVLVARRRYQPKAAAVQVHLGLAARQFLLLGVGVVAADRVTAPTAPGAGPATVASVGWLPAITARSWSRVSVRFNGGGGALAGGSGALAACAIGIWIGCSSTGARIASGLSHRRVRNRAQARRMATWRRHERSGSCGAWWAAASSKIVASTVAGFGAAVRGSHAIRSITADQRDVRQQRPARTPPCVARALPSAIAPSPLLRCSCGDGVSIPAPSSSVACPAECSRMKCPSRAACAGDRLHPCLACRLRPDGHPHPAAVTPPHRPRGRCMPTVRADPASASCSRAAARADSRTWACSRRWSARTCASTRSRARRWARSSAASTPAA